MGLRGLMQHLGFWTDVFKWSEPSILRVRLRGDWWLRLAIALGAGGAGTCLLLVLFAINQRPPHPLFALIGGGVAWNGEPAHVVPDEAAIVANISRAIRPERRAIGAAAKFGNDLDLPIPHARQRLALDLDQDDASIRHGDRAFRKQQPLGKDFEVHRRALQITNSGAGSRRL